MGDVIDLKAPKKEEVDKENTEEKSEDFEAIMKRNKEKQERMKQERLKANKGVLKSYRIKP